jgi:methionyl-tRNA synthetase
MVEKYFDGQVPALGGGPVDDVSRELMDLMKATPDLVDRSLDELAFSEALTAIWTLIARANVYIEKQAPWTLAKNGQTTQLALVLVNLVEVLKLVTGLIAPFMPETAVRLNSQLNPGGLKVAKGEPLFPRIQK